MGCVSLTLKLPSLLVGYPYPILLPSQAEVKGSTSRNPSLGIVTDFISCEYACRVHEYMLHPSHVI